MFLLTATKKTMNIDDIKQKKEQKKQKRRAFYINQWQQSTIIPVQLIIYNKSEIYECIEFMEIYRKPKFNGDSSSSKWRFEKHRALLRFNKFKMFNVHNVVMMKARSIFTRKSFSNTIKIYPIESEHKIRWQRINCNNNNKCSISILISNARWIPLNCLLTLESVVLTLDICKIILSYIFIKT